MQQELNLLNCWSKERWRRILPATINFATEVLQNELLSVLFLRIFHHLRLSEFEKSFQHFPQSYFPQSNFYGIEYFGGDELPTAHQLSRRVTWRNCHKYNSIYGIKVGLTVAGVAMLCPSKSCLLSSSDFRNQDKIVDQCIVGGVELSYTDLCVCVHTISHDSIFGKFTPENEFVQDIVNKYIQPHLVDILKVVFILQQNIVVPANYMELSDKPGSSSMQETVR
jgi:hypothetical protein